MAGTSISIFLRQAGTSKLVPAKQRSAFPERFRSKRAQQRQRVGSAAHSVDSIEVSRVLVTNTDFVHKCIFDLACMWRISKVGTLHKAEMCNLRFRRYLMSVAVQCSESRTQIIPLRRFQVSVCSKN